MTTIPKSELSYLAQVKYWVIDNFSVDPMAGTVALLELVDAPVSEPTIDNYYSWAIACNYIKR